MSNLKKVLSVGLASTMVMGMVATSAAAATYDKFSDKDEIVNKDAVSMVTELGIIAGLPGGNYGPKQNIDRASFARLVCVALNGGKEPNLGNLKTSFTDTQNNWAEKYIAYCVQQGIIAGKGNNTFAPAANVTGSEAAKMLLVALGYNATYEGIGGATWQVTTDVLANKAGLYKDLTSDPLTRDNAAQMIYNTLNATMVKYEMVPGISANGQVTMTTQRVNVTKTIDGGKTVNVTLLGDKFNTKDIDPAVMTEFTYNDVKEEYTYFFDAKDKDGKEISFTTELDFTGLFRQKVQVIAKDDNNNTVYGMYAVDSDVLATGSKDDLETKTDGIKVDGTTYKLDKGFQSRYYKTGDVVEKGYESLTGLYNFSLIDVDGNNKADSIVVTPFELLKVSYVGKDSVTFQHEAGDKTEGTAGNVDKDDVNLYEGIAKDDYAIGVKDTYANDEVTTYTKADVKSGKVEGTKNNGDLKIDGEWLKNASGETIVANDTIDYIAFGGTIYYAKVTEGSVNSNDIAFVVTVGEDTGVSNIDSKIYKAKLLFTDGTKKVVEVEVDAKAEASFKALSGKMVTYKVNSDGEYKLVEVADKSNDANYDGFVTGSVVAKDGKVNAIDKYELADDAIVFLAKIDNVGDAKADNDAKVITGKEAKSLTAAGYASTGVLYSAVNGFTYGRVAVLWDDAELATPALNENYAYLLADAYVSNDGKDDYTNYTLWTVDGELTVQEKGNDNADLKSGAVVTYDTDGKLIKNVKTVAKLTADAVTGYDEKSGKIQFSINNSTNYEITDDTTVLYVDTKNDKGQEGGSIALADKPENLYINNVLVVVPSTGKELALVIVDVNNEIDGGSKGDYTLGADANSSAINNALNNGDVVLEKTLTNKIEVTVPAGRTLTVKAGGETGSTITAAPGATVVIGDKELIGEKGVTSDKAIELKLNSNNAFDVTCKGTLTLNADLKLGGNDNLTNVTKVVAAKDGIKLTAATANAVKGDVLSGADGSYSTSEETLNGAYTWTTGKATGDKTVSGWLKG